MSRTDITDYLIHFTCGETEKDAFACLLKILSEQRLLGGNRMIKGGFSCVCFSEAPIKDLELGLVNPDYYSKYPPFGIMVQKHWLFPQGGRPVIYESDKEYEQLPPTHKWRHVRYEPNAEPPIDFTWEREWRIQIDELEFDPATAKIVVRDESWAQALIDEHEWHNEINIQPYVHILSEDVARMMVEKSFVWNILTLK